MALGCNPAVLLDQKRSYGETDPAIMAGDCSHGLDIDAEQLQLEQAAADAIATQCSEVTACRLWELFLAHWLRVVSVARSIRRRCLSASTLHDLYGSCATHSGDAPVLRTLKVNATIARDKVVHVTRSQFDCGPVTLQLLVSAYSKDKLLRSVFLFLPNFQAFDIVCFYEAVGGVGGVVKAGNLTALLVQGKHCGVDRVSKTGWSTVHKCVTELKNANVVLGDTDFCATWRQRMVYVYFSNQELTSDEKGLTGEWAEQAIILARADSARLLGNMVGCLSQVIGLPRPSGVGASPSQL